MRWIDISSVAFTLLLGGCSHYNAQQQQQTQIEKACTSLAQSQNRDLQWLTACKAGDEAVAQQGLETWAKSLEPSEICHNLIIHYHDNLEGFIQSSAQSRGINCNQIIYTAALANAEMWSVNIICPIWYNRNQHPAVISAVDQAVKDRSLDCISAVNGIRQSQAMQQQLFLQQEQINSQNSLASSLATSAHRPYNCQSTGYGGSVQTACY